MPQDRRSDRFGSIGGNVVAKGGAEFDKYAHGKAALRARRRNSHGRGGMLRFT